MTEFKTFDDLIHMLGEPVVNYPPITPRMIRAVTLDVIAAARYLDARVPIHGKYRAAQTITNATDTRLADRGAPPYLVMAIAGGVVRKVAASLNDYDDDAEGTAAVLASCRESLMWGLENGTSTIHECNLGKTVLQMADPFITDEQRFVRAKEWSEKRGMFDSLSVIHCAAELISTLASFTDNADVLLDRIVVKILEADLAETTEGK